MGTRRTRRSKATDASSAPRRGSQPKRQRGEKQRKTVKPFSTKTMYTCGIAWQHDIGEAPDLEGKQPMYSTIEELKNSGVCWESCGIVELEVSCKRWVEPQDLKKVFEGDYVEFEVEPKSTE